MTDNLEELENWVGPMLAKLDAKERRNLMKDIARDLRRSNQQRMKQQAGPDGAKWEPRKPQNIRGKAGSIKRKAMFTKLRTAKHLKIQTTSGSAGVSFLGRVGRIARTHQYGLTDQVEKGGPRYDYPARPLVGLSAEDIDNITDRILDHLQPGKR